MMATGSIRKQLFQVLSERGSAFRASLFSNPLHQCSQWLPWVIGYGGAALSIGFASGIYSVQFLDLAKFWYLPLTLFLFPSIPEEFFFRGLIIPRNAAELPLQKRWSTILVSAISFTLWHPLNALTINPTAQPFFLNPYFLVIVFLLGITCSVAYVQSRSIWTPVAIHWLTVVVWVVFLGGRNLVLES